MEILKMLTPRACISLCVRIEYMQIYFCTRTLVEGSREGRHVQVPIGSQACPTVNKAHLPQQALPLVSPGQRPPLCPLSASPSVTPASSCQSFQIKPRACAVGQAVFWAAGGTGPVEVVLPGDRACQPRLFLAAIHFEAVKGS